MTEQKVPYIIAEIGANHNGSMQLARDTIDAASAAGCDAVKFQSWDASLFSEIVYKENRFLSDDYNHRTDHSLRSTVESYGLVKSQLHELAAYCSDIGIDFLSTPFALSQIDALVEFGVKYLKIASMDLVSDYLIRHAAGTGLPILLSTGFGTLSEIEHALHTIESEGNSQITLLHCVSLYPTPDKMVNLANIPMLSRTFGYPVGFSDHTVGIDISLASFAIGSMLLEKHFTLSKDMEGWDHRVSADPKEMQAICLGRDRIADAIGVDRRRVSDRERQNAVEYRRSIVAGHDMPAGTVLTENDLDYKRPGRGLPPNTASLIIGRQLNRALKADELIEWQHLDAGPR